MEHLLYIVSESLYIYWYYIWPIYFWCYHNVWFFVLDKVSFVSTLFRNNYFIYNFSNYSLCCFSNTHDIPQVIQIRTFQVQEYYIQEGG